VIDIEAIKSRFEALSPHLSERARRLFAASEAHAAGRGGVTAVAAATGVARSTIGRGLAELRSEAGTASGRIRRPGGGRKPKVKTEPGLLEAEAVPISWSV
jgi:DNA invertase Pin-like site-specific DNA recombinase